MFKRIQIKDKLESVRQVESLKQETIGYFTNVYLEDENLNN